MTTVEIGKFLVVCAPASELYFLTYYGAASSKDTKLTREATHYRVNCDRVLREVEEKLTPNPAKPKPKPLPPPKADGKVKSK